MRKRNPVVGEHPDLFERGPTRVVRAIDAMSKGELRSLPRSAFSDEEWRRLDLDIQEHILEHDPGKAARDERIEELVKFFVDRHEWLEKPDARYMADRFGDDFDMMFGDAADEIIERARDSGHTADVNEIESHFEAAGYSAEQIETALKEALQDNNNYVYDYNTDDYGRAMFKAQSTESFYVDEDELAKELEGLADDEIEEALVEINRKTYLSLKLPDLERKYGLDIQEYTTYYADADPDWDKVMSAVDEALQEQDPEPAEVPTPPEERIVHRFENGAYLLDLLPSEMPTETKLMGHCIGRSDHSYMSQVKAGKAKAFSLRRPAGKPLFTFFVLLDRDGNMTEVAQIKGNSNRLPGWDLGHVGEGKVKADEVLKAIEVVQSFGLEPEDVTDLRPGLQALKGLPVPRENPRRNSRHACNLCGGT